MSRGPRRIGTANSGKHSLSLCMMVKNESATLEKCLRLARPHVDEIVVVDTGSTDGTQDIARRYADVYDEIEWPDSFAIARNHTFDLANGDYILVLDGDEYLESTVGWNRIRKTIRQSDLACAQLVVTNLLSEGQIVSADRVWQERIFRNHPALRYHGRVHHQIQEQLVAFVEKTGFKVQRTEAEIVHTGYALADEKMATKYEPRLHLLREEYDNPRSDLYRAYYGYQLGVAYYVLRRFDEAFEVLNEIDYAEMTEQNAFYAHLLAAQAALKLSNAPMSLVHCNEMLTLTRTEPVAYFTTGLALLQAKQVGDGMLMLLEAYNVNDAGGLGVRFVLDPNQVLRMLARICRQINLQDHAKIFQAMFDKGSHDPELVKKIIKTLKVGIVRTELDARAA